MQVGSCYMSQVQVAVNLPEYSNRNLGVTMQIWLTEISLRNLFYASTCDQTKGPRKRAPPQPFHQASEDKSPLSKVLHQAWLVHIQRDDPWRHLNLKRSKGVLYLSSATVRRSSSNGSNSCRSCCINTSLRRQRRAASKLKTLQVC